MKLKNPLGVAACAPLTGNLDMLRRLEEAGAAVAVMPSLFEEQIEHDELEFNRMFEYQSESFAEAITHFPALNEYNTGARDYLRHIEAAKQAVSIPIIGSLNGAFARRLDSLRQDDRRSRRRRIGIEYLLRSDRRPDDGGRCRTTLH